MDSFRTNGNDLVLQEYVFCQGPYRMAIYRGIVDTDYTEGKDAALILGDDFIRYLDLYFAGWRLLRFVKEHPARYRGGGFYKNVRYILRFGTDADAETVVSRLRKGEIWVDHHHRRCRF